jgi:hypothetical protein
MLQNCPSRPVCDHFSFYCKRNEKAAAGSESNLSKWLADTHLLIDLENDGGVLVSSLAATGDPQSQENAALKERGRSTLIWRPPELSAILSALSANSPLTASCHLWRSSDEKMCHIGVEPIVEFEMDVLACSLRHPAPQPLHECE